MRKEVLLSYFQKITVKRYQQLVAAFLNLENVWQAEFSDFKEKVPWDDNLINEFLTWREQLNEEKITQDLIKENINCLTIKDPGYPPLLKEIYDPPICLFIKGKLKKDSFNLAVVGTRKFSQYGKQVTEEIISILASQGITIISGLALGIDSIAHEQTIKSGGETIAVLGSGIDWAHLYPKDHRQLAERIINSGGAIISEYSPGTIGTSYSFPRRNRIVAGISLGTLVIEAPTNSGSLITAQCALDNNREVFAIPQNINTQNSVGPNNLLKMGAKLVTSAEDIIEVLNLQKVQQFVENKKVLPESPTEAVILEQLSREPKHIDQITKNCNLPSYLIGSTLTMMEMKGKVKNIGNMMYILNN